MTSLVDRVPLQFRLPLLYCLPTLPLYFLILIGPAKQSLTAALISAFANVGPHLLVGIPLAVLLVRRTHGLKWWIGIIAALACAIPYSLLAYWFMMSIFAVLRSGVGETFVLTRFPSAADSWQLLQSVVFWLLWHAAALAGWHLRETEARRGDSLPEAAPPDVLLIRDSDTLVSIPVSEIVCIQAEGDFCRIHTLQANYESRRSLNSLGEKLASAGFIRVHRSCLVNIERLERAEPSGDGGMTLHLANGLSIRASRAGTKTLRAASA